MIKIHDFEKNYMEKSWREESHKVYKTDKVDESVKLFNSFLKSKGVEGSLLDVGCGNGKNALFFQSNGFNSLGIDFSESAINICDNSVKKIVNKPKFRVVDVLKFKSKTKFDVVIDCGCLHHIRRSLWFEYKKMILNHLKIGGYYYLHGVSNCVQNKCLPKHPNKRNWIVNKKGHYTTFLSEEDISKLLGSGFKIVKSFDFKSVNSLLMIKTFFIQRLK